MQLPAGALQPRTLEADARVGGLLVDFRACREGGHCLTYMARLMRLSLLSPEMVDTIMEGRHPAGITLANLMDPFPLNWEEQRALWAAEPPQV